MRTRIGGHPRLGLLQVSLAGLLWGTTGVVVQWVIAEMKDYLPNDSTLFLLDYELDYSIGKLLEATALH